MNTATKLTTNSQLRARIRELEAQTTKVDPTAETAADLADNVYEYRFPIPGHATGGHAYIALRKCHDTGLWAVTDGTAGTFPEQFWNGRRWQPITPQVPTGVVFGWATVDYARAQVPKLLDQAAAAHQAWAESRERVARIEAIAASTLPAEGTPVEVAPEDAVEEPATRRHAKPGVDMPAPKDLPGYGENGSRMAATVRDTTLPQLAEDEADQKLLTRLGESIPATTTPVAEAEETPETDTEKTALIDPATIRDLVGMGETQPMPALVHVDPVPPAEDLPPKPEVPPVVGAFPPLEWGVKESHPLAAPDLKKRVSAAEVASHRVITVRLNKPGAK